MSFDMIAISDAEGITLIKHVGAFAFLLVFYSRWIPRRNRDVYGFRNEFQKDPNLVLGDIVAGAVFVSLLITSLCLLLLPAQGLRTEAGNLSIRGEITDQWVRPYLWVPDSAGSYGTVGGKVLYFPELLSTVEGTHTVLFQAGNSYAVQIIGQVSQGQALQIPWYIFAGRWLMILSGGYLVIRLGIVMAIEGVAEKKKWEKNVEKYDPIFRFMDWLDRF